jgi:Adenovirus endoprotease
MNSKQLFDFFERSHSTNFGGVYSADTLPRKIKSPIGLIVNTAPKSHPGEHWIAIFVDKAKIGYYFDSFGLPPTVSSISAFLRRNCTKIQCNQKQIQHLNSTKCGQFSAVYLKFRFAGRMSKVYLDLFNHDLSLNERIIDSYYKYFTQ